jgi:uncharacterized membrane protein YhaH (DUF805 family)
MKKEAKMNAPSYFFTMLFALPALSLSNVISRSDELFAPVGAITGFVLLVLTVIWSVRRLRNSGKSAWWAFALIPPATILLLIYNLFAPSSSEHPNYGFYMYGIRAKGFWRILLIVSISLFLAYLIALYITFLTDGM